MPTGGCGSFVSRRIRSFGINSAALLCGHIGNTTRATRVQARKKQNKKDKDGYVVVVERRASEEGAGRRSSKGARNFDPVGVGSDTVYAVCALHIKPLFPNG